MQDVQKKTKHCNFRSVYLMAMQSSQLTCDIIRIKMTSKDLPCNESTRPKHTVKIYFMKISTKITQILYIPIGNGP